MARLQILELPEGTGDDRPPFALIIDQCEGVPLELVEAVESHWRQVGEQIGARGTLVFMESVGIPANAAPGGAEDREGDAQTGELIHAHEQTRLALCDALLLTRDTTWHQLIEQIAERQGELAGLHRERETLDPELVDLVVRTLGIQMTPGGISPQEVLARACRELEKSEAARAHVRHERAEARQWARHGYEIGQKHCSWSDHGVAPGWLTEGWPPHIDSCEHLKHAAEFDEALTRVRGLPERPEIMDSQHSNPSGYLYGYGAAIRAAKRAAENGG